MSLLLRQLQSPRPLPLPLSRLHPRWAIQTRNYELPVSSLKKRAVIKHKGKLWVVSSFAHRHQGRQGSHFNLDLVDIKSGAKLSERFNSGTVLEGVDLEKRQLQYLYTLDDQIHLMHPETFEETAIAVDLLDGGAKAVPFLQDGMMIRVDLHEGVPVQVEAPDRGNYLIQFTAPPPSSSTNESSKGTASKYATLDNGVEILVPDFIEPGDSVTVHIAEQRYLGRAAKK
ncbi:uncharacterized protein BJ171DRAFT_492941 [Polychytrium aggregatum]|uniref:uncharacterized protein n=1 Tax=Polychytrium aggregatum TaxID=110093 RepID=UPI0022FF3BF3|nr:uncharacterized protein BJ171DRAFT_492941 [Polychytrium aggregatum]KAI9207515.1 hypothetical protein BJ171DRAFT_492941 [Polychytrium aggregatum]